ncbi:helicase associated domain-containing protein [Streptomyces sp. NPDC002403]
MRPLPGIGPVTATGSSAQRRAPSCLSAGDRDKWDTGWQRCYRLVQNHVQAGGALPEAAGDVVVQGEDLGRWVPAQRFGWEQLLPVQQWILENTLGLRAAWEDERPVKRTQDTMWALNLTAARQFHAREGHLRVPRKHAEQLEALSGRQDGADGPVVVRLGTWLGTWPARCSPRNVFLVLSAQAPTSNVMERSSMSTVLSSPLNWKPPVLTAPVRATV